MWLVVPERYSLRSSPAAGHTVCVGMTFYSDRSTQTLLEFTHLTVTKGITDFSELPHISARGRGGSALALPHLETAALLSASLFLWQRNRSDHRRINARSSARRCSSTEDKSIAISRAVQVVANVCL